MITKQEAERKHEFNVGKLNYLMGRGFAFAELMPYKEMEEDVSTTVDQWGGSIEKSLRFIRECLLAPRPLTNKHLKRLEALIEQTTDDLYELQDFIEDMKSAI